MHTVCIVYIHGITCVYSTLAREVERQPSQLDITHHVNKHVEKNKQTNKKHDKLALKKTPDAWMPSLENWDGGLKIFVYIVHVHVQIHV